MVQRAALAIAEDAGEIEDAASRRPPAASCRRIPARCADRAASRSPSAPISSVAKACRWVSLPGETCSAAVSTSMKSCRVEPARAAPPTIALRASRNGRRSAWTCGAQKGEASASTRPAFLAIALVIRVEYRLWCGAETGGRRPIRQTRCMKREGHRKLRAQGQCPRHRRQALHRAHRRELPSRQGHAHDADRHAPHLRRREDRRSATRPPSRSSAPMSRSASTATSTRTATATSS